MSTKALSTRARGTVRTAQDFHCSSREHFSSSLLVLREWVAKAAENQPGKVDGSQHGEARSWFLSRK